MPLACLRSLFSLAFVASLLILAGAFYLEFAKGLLPCPLCQSQRVVLARVHLIQAGADHGFAVQQYFALIVGFEADQQPQ